MARRTRYFQWVDGELKGTITTLKSIYEFDGEYFYELDDGESCNMRLVAPMTNNPEEIKNKFLVEVLSPSYAWSVETIGTSKRMVYDEQQGEHMIEVPCIDDIIQGGGAQEVSINSKLGQKRLVPPACNTRMPLPDINDYMENRHVEPAPAEQTPVPETPKHQEVINNDAPVVSKQQEEPKQKKFNPVRILVDSCKKHDTEITMSINIALPGKGVYNMAADEFENGDGLFIDCIVSDIDTDVIVESLKSALIQAYSGNADK